MPGKHLQFPLTVGPLTAVPTDSCLHWQLSPLTVVSTDSCPHWQLSDLTVVWSDSCRIWQLISDSCLLTPSCNMWQAMEERFNLCLDFHICLKGVLKNVTWRFGFASFLSSLILMLQCDDQHSKFWSTRSTWKEELRIILHHWNAFSVILDTLWNFSFDRLHYFKSISLFLNRLRLVI